MNSLRLDKHLYFPKIIGYSEKHLCHIISNIDSYYRPYLIIKKDQATHKPKQFSDGTVKQRQISPSHGDLKIIQGRIKTRILDLITIPEFVHGGIRGKSNITNAKAHKGNKYIFTTDIHGFFPSITPGMVRAAFLKLGYNSQFVYYLTRLTTWKGELPQGTKTSSHIANIVFLEIDDNIHTMCKIHGIRYTRFVDDLTFSAPYDFANQIPNIIELVRRHGFSLSRRKTTYTAYQVITGIQVFNNFIEVSPSVLKKVIMEKSLEDHSKKFATRYREQVIRTN